MDQKFKDERLREYLEKVAPGIYDNRHSGLEGMRGTDQELSGLEGGLEKLASNQPLTSTESAGLEAIVHKKYRPALLVRKNTFDEPPAPWTHFGTGINRENIEGAILSIGRIELPDHGGIPYGGTGFVVGEGLIMTNRHVAEIFTRGLGSRNLRFKTGMSAGINFLREHQPYAVPPIQDNELSVVNIVMIHPYWDMALLRVEGLTAAQKPLLLSTEHTENLSNLDIAVVGYPAQDPRNDIALQNEIFDNVYDVKRLQPGKLELRESIRSYGTDVLAVTHDASTLGGNSGSAVIDVQSGRILALHFAGLYLKANYAVPTYELARDQRVVDAGVNFKDSITTDADWAHRWDMADKTGETAHTAAQSSGQQAPPSSNGITVNTNPGQTGGTHNSISVTIPLTVTVSIGSPVQSAAPGVDTQSNNISSSPQQEGIFGSQIDETETIREAYHRADARLIEQPGYSTPAALTTAAASALVYSNDVALIEQTCTQELNFDSCKYLKQKNTECFVAQSSATVLVCFRGTQGIRDWIANLRLNEESTQFGMVHGGFLRAFHHIRPQLQKLLDESVNNKALVLTGHSLGGALATIAASEWRNVYPIRSVYTFGQPAVGDREFQQSMEHRKDSFFRIVNDDDIVTKIPPFYRHVGQRVKLPSNRQLGAARESIPLESTSSDTMLPEIDFYQLQERLSLESQSVGTEGLLPSFSDHKIANYLHKLIRQIEIS